MTSLLKEWESFYVIVGSAAGALIGLQFVVMTLLTERPKPRSQAVGSAFATPTIVHFSTVLLLSAVAAAPWQNVAIASLLWGAIGLTGLVYSVFVIRKIGQQTDYQPIFEDWLFHVLLPLAGYGGLTISAFIARWYGREALFGIGVAALMLLFVGIHNAWDAVVYHFFSRKDENPDS